MLRLPSGCTESTMNDKNYPYFIVIYEDLLCEFFVKNMFKVSILKPYYFWVKFFMDLISRYI